MLPSDPNSKQCKNVILRFRLHEVSASILWQLFDDASDTALIENNGAAPQ